MTHALVLRERDILDELGYQRRGGDDQQGRSEGPCVQIVDRAQIRIALSDLVYEIVAMGISRQLPKHAGGKKYMIKDGMTR